MQGARSRLNFVIAGSFALLAASGCVQKQVKRVNEVPVVTAQADVPESQLLDIVVVSFDPGVPKTLEEQKKQKVYPSVRQAEANYFPQVLRQTLDGTGYWGSVRVLPEATPGADVTVQGKILQSDGEKLKLQITASDATGRKWLDKTYESTAAELAYTEKLPAGTDPFQDLYNRAANDILAERNKLTSAQTLEVQRVADLRFASDLAPDRFKEYLVKDKSGRYVVARLPPSGDPYLQKVDQIRQRDDLLVDTLDAHYAVFRQSMEPAYQDWRKSSYQETVALRELESQALWRKVLGAAAIVGGVVVAAKANNYGEAIGGQLGVIGGIYALQSGIAKGKEADVHAEALKELNQSIETDVQPRVVELEGKTVTLTGSAKEQYDQWRKLLHERYASETGSGS
jgi:hypothetical protein